MDATTTHPAMNKIWAWLDHIPDPEIPVLSITDLGIVRTVAWSEADPELCIVTMTPTYSGCPATEVIAGQVRQELHRRGIPRVEVRTQLSPAWTTDWLTEKGRTHLSEYGIVPPQHRSSADERSPLAHLIQIAPLPTLSCPRCGSTRTETISQFGSTPCKSLHRCLSCLEPFDYFKPH